MYSYIDLKNSVKVLTDDDLFLINEIKISENHFGNIIIKLYSKDLRIKFILEKNNFWCEIGCEDELYFLEDVLSLLNVEFENKKSNLIDYIEIVSNIVLEKYKELSKLFLEENLLSTNEKLKRIGIERANKCLE